MDLRRICNESGLTLVELTIATLMLSTVFLGAASLYVSGIKFLNATQADTSQVQNTAGAEELTKRISLANEAYIDGAGVQLRLKGDYRLGTYAPNNTPSDPSDDTWVKFRFIPYGTAGLSNLHWRADPASAPLQSVGSMDPVLITDLRTGASFFSLANPSGQGQSTVISVTMATQINGSSGTETLQTNASLGAKAKR